MSVSECYVNSSKISGNNYVGGVCGGIIGGHLSRFSSSLIFADVSGNSRVGGICGYSDSGGVNMDNCCYIGNISAGCSDGNSYVGGLIGYMKINWTTMYSTTNCFAIGTVFGGGNYIGGLIGYDEGRDYYNNGYNNITNCYFSGAISGQNYTAG